MIMLSRGVHGERVFRRYRPWVVLETSVYGVLSGALGLGAVLVACPILALLALLPGILAVRVVLRYQTEAVVIHGVQIRLRYGVLAVNEYLVPLWACTPQYRRGVLARLLNYGTIGVEVHGTIRHMPQIGHFRTLAALIALHQSALGGIGWR